MKKIIISAENICDMDEKEIEKYGISIIKKNSFDGSCLTTFENSKNELNEFDYYNYFAKLLQSCDEIIHFCVSSQFNSMYENAVLGAEKLDNEDKAKVHIVDSKNGSLALALMLRIASEMAQNGSTIQDIKTMANEMSNHISAVYTSEELSSLPITHKMNKFTAFWSKLFKKIGIFKINTKGKLQAFASTKSKQKALKKLAKYIVKKYDNYGDLPVYILYSNCEDDAKMLQQEIQSYINVPINIKPIKTKQPAPKKALAMFFTSSSK